MLNLPILTYEGRTKHFINVFGEELVIENANKALELVCQRHHVQLVDYTCGFLYANFLSVHCKFYFLAWETYVEVNKKFSQSVIDKIAPRNVTALVEFMFDHTLAKPARTLMWS